MTEEVGADFSGAQPVYGSLWTRITTLGLEGLKDVAILAADSPYGTLLASRAATRPTVENRSTSALVIKLESCEAGFTSLAAGSVSTPSRFYGPVDGVQPPVSGWSAGDWFKVQDGIRIAVEAGGLPPTPSGLGLVVACWSDNPADPDYLRCGGHKAEPHWSDKTDLGGAGAVDWRFPRPSEVTCSSDPWYKQLFAHVGWVF